MSNFSLPNPYELTPTGDDIDLFGSKTATNFAHVYQSLNKLLDFFRGSVEPNPVTAGMLWEDTTANPGLLKLRNDTNSGWIVLGTLTDKLGHTPAYIGAVENASGVKKIRTGTRPATGATDEFHIDSATGRWSVGTGTGWNTFKGYVGTKTVDEANIANQYVLSYNLAQDKLEYVPQTGGAGGGAAISDTTVTASTVWSSQKTQTEIGTVGSAASAATNAANAAATAASNADDKVDALIATKGQINGIAPLNASGKLDDTYLVTNAANGLAKLDASGKIATTLLPTSHQRGGANGLAPLGADSKVPVANLPTATTPLTDSKLLLANASGKLDAANVTTTSTMQFVTQANIDSWNSKASGTGLSSETNNGLMSTDQYTKLQGIEAQANKYVHPVNHPADMISTDANRRFVTDTEKTTWDGKASTDLATQTAHGLFSKDDKKKLDTDVVVKDTAGLIPRANWRGLDLKDVTTVAATATLTVDQMAGKAVKYTGTTAATLTLPLASAVDTGVMSIVTHEGGSPAIVLSGSGQGLPTTLYKGDTATLIENGGAWHVTTVPALNSSGFLPMSRGGTGVGTKEDLITALAVQKTAERNLANGYAGLGANGTVALAQGGTGATTAAEARANLGLQITITAGVVNDGQTIQLPPNYTRAQCKYIVSMENSNANDISWDIQEGGSFRQYKQVCGVDQATGQVSAYSYVYGKTGVTDGYYTLPGRANYLCIAIK